MASGLVSRHLFDLDAALGREHAEVELGRTVEGEAGVVLLGDVGRVLDPQPLHDVALDVEAEDVAGVEAHLVGVGGQLHAARLAAAADLHLRLDHHRVAGGLGLRDGLVDRVGHPAGRDGNAEAGEVLLALVLVEVHFGCCLLCACFLVTIGDVGIAVEFGLRPARAGRRRRRRGAGACDQPWRASSRASRASASHEPMASRGAPGVKTWATPSAFRDGDVGLGDDAADDHEHVAAAGVGQQLDHLGHQGEVRAREQGEPDGVGVLLDDGLNHLLGRLVEAGVDDLEPAVAQGPGDDLGPPVVPVEAGLGHDHPVGTFHAGPRIRMALVGRQIGGRPRRVRRVRPGRRSRTPSRAPTHRSATRTDRAASQVVRRATGSQMTTGMSRVVLRW